MKHSNTNKKRYYQIIPLVRLPLTKSNEFTYHSQREISLGSVVKIKLNNKLVKGVVIKEIIRKPNFKTQTVEEVITPAQLTEKQVALAKLISEYYLTSLSTTLKFFSWQLTKKDNSAYFSNLNKQLKEIGAKKWQEKITLTTAQKEAVNKIKQNNKPNSLLFGPPASGKTEVAITTVKNILEKGKQVLILIPEIFLSYQEIVRYSGKFLSAIGKEQIAIIHSRLKPSEITTIWNGVKSGKIKLIIGTRMGVFLPFKKLGLIIVDEEQDISHKQWDTPPFYHTRQVSEFLQQVYRQYKPNILLLASTPSLSGYQKARKGKDWQIVKLKSLQTDRIKVRPPQIELIDLKKYYRRGQQILISNELKTALRNSLSENKIAMILVPRRGKSSTIICQDCREIPTCPDCQTPLVHSENYYRCLHCGFKISNISKCPHCGSFRLADIGFGTESVQDLIQTIFPKAKTAIADGTTFNNNAYRQKVLENLYKNKLDFLIGTYAIAKGLDIETVNLVAILNADNWPGQTDFRFDENYLSTLFQLAGRTNRPGGDQNGQCLIQTFDPTNRIFSYLKNWSWEDFLKYELANREALSYPPFKHLIKITFKHALKETVDKELSTLNEKIKKILKEKNLTNKVVILPPYYGYQEKLRGKFQKHLLLKVDKLPLTNKELLKILDLSTGWKIDVEPENIF